MIGNYRGISEGYHTPMSVRYFVLMVSTDFLIEITISSLNKATATMLDLISLGKSSEYETSIYRFRLNKRQRMDGKRQQAFYVKKHIISTTSKYVCIQKQALTVHSLSKEGIGFLSFSTCKTINYLPASQPAI